MIVQEYLLSYGSMGEFGRFRPATPLVCRRGDRAVVRSHRGLELATLLCPATPGHAHFLPNTTVGQLLRRAGADDERLAEAMRQRGAELIEDGRRLAAEMELPLEVIDGEVLLDGEHAVLHHLPWAEFDERPLVSALSRQYNLHVRLHSLKTAEEPEGCGRPDCGRGEGGCSSCGSCGTCGTTKKETEYFAGLREKMERQRTPLL